MVLASPTPLRNEKILTLDIPIIDLSAERSTVSKLIVKACKKFGFFKVINHGVSYETIAKMEAESLNFFAKPAIEKQAAGPPNPLGYGCKNIGFNGDMGEVEYLLLGTDPSSIDIKSKFISTDPEKFSSAVSGYVEAVRNLACELLDLMAEGLWVQDRSYFSRMIRAVDSDSCFRLNHYPPVITKDSALSARVGFGEHSDPQILTILRSNAVDGLQISLDRDVWIPVSPDPAAFCVNVGDVLQAMTNGKFVSVRHRALSNTSKSRISMAFFGAPSLNAWVSCPPEMVTESSSRPSLYRAFTWAEYKAVAYSLRLGDSRLDLFRNCTHEHDDNIAAQQKVARV